MTCPDCGLTEGYAHGFADPKSPQLGGRRQNDEPDAVNNIEISINGRVWKIFAGQGTDSSPEFFRQKQKVDAMCKRKTAETGKKWSWAVTGAPATTESVTESLGRAVPKMPKPRDPGHAILAAKRTSGAAGQHTNKRRQEILQPKHKKPPTRDMDLTEDIERHLMQMRRAGYDIK